MRIRKVPVEQINPAAYNPRLDLQPGDAEYEALERSIDSFGCVEPLVWNERTGNLVGGHQRFKVLKAKGLKQIEVSVVDLPPEQEKALNLALNKVQGDWDNEKLARLLNELIETPDLDFALTGFEVQDARDIISEILGDLDGQRAEEFDVEAALKAGGEPVTQPGDMIELGADPARTHRLLCGDCTDPEQVKLLMGGQRAVLFATDPPYLVGYDGTNHPAPPTKHTRKKLGKRSRARGPGKDWSAGYGCTWDDANGSPDLYEKFIRAAIDEAILPNAAWYCWHASRRQAMLEQVWTDAGVLAHCQLVWVKNRSVPTRTWYLWQHEPCLMGWIKGNMPPRATKRRLPTVWQIDTLGNGPDRPDHPTPKPLEVFEIPMAQHTKPGEICYEPFAGSGTQFIAAERLARRCFGIEISPQYCDLIVRRFIAWAGEGAVAPEIAEKYRLPVGQEAA